MLKAIIVDDVKLNRDSLRLLIGKYLPELEVVGVAGSVKEAMELIRLQKPDIVFLDVEMPGGSGFDLLDAAAGFQFSVIFVTAFDEYAIRAFKVSAVDYLLKPINIDELINAVRKVQKADRKSIISQFSLLQETMSLEKPEELSRIAISTANGLRFIEVKDLIRLEADGKYTRCFLQNGQNFHSSKNLGEIEKILNSQWFFRIHHSHLVNLRCISSFSRTDHVIIMKNEDQIGVSHRRRAEFIKRFQMI